MAVRLKVAAWALIPALWAGEICESIAYPNWLSPAADALIDSLTVVVTLSLIAWSLAERFGHPRIVADLEKRLAAQERGLMAAFEYAGVSVPGKRHLRAVGDDTGQPQGKP
jgi:hypothetical protein